MSDKYLFKRLVAYIIDMLVVSVFTITLTEVKYLNPTFDEYNTNNDALEELTESYIISYLYLEEYYDDSVISTEEYEELIDSNMFSYLFVDSYSDNSISEEEKDYIIDTVETYYNENINKLYHTREKSSWYVYTVYIVVYLLYFVGFNIITKGSTLGKRLMNLRIESIYDDGYVKWYQYLFRTILLYGLIFYIIELALPFVVGDTSFMNISNIILYMGSFVNLIIMCSIAFSKDKRGLHDILSKTRVIESE